ncbi:MAG: acyl-homoserine-lactone acylase, partial [Solirubrobacteraceae bacterium]|nr:acyl-homoserine-lactone acylase [Solirubrobacteraceae bacterium]
MRARWPITAIFGGLVLVLLAVPALGRKPAARHSSAPALSATIRRTAHGIPHIEARSYAGLGYGYGYAFAQDNLCTIAEQYVTVRAERSRYFGPDKEYTQRGNGFTVNNLNSDIFWKQVSDSRVVDHLLARRPPFGPKSEVKELVRGYVAGYNRYLRKAGGFRHLPDRTCRGKPWVRPISIRDAYLRFYQLVLLASGDVAIDGIASATPPTGIGTAPPRLSAA